MKLNVSRKYLDVFEVKPVEDGFGPILGKVGASFFGGEKAVMLKMRDSFDSEPQNLVVVGNSGNEKKDAFLMNYLFQVKRRNESVFVECDYPEMAEKVKALFANTTYTVKELNFNKVSESDGWNFMRAIKGRDADETAQMIVKTILLNNSDASGSIYAQCDENIMTALMLRIALDDGRKFPEEDKNFVTLYRELAHPEGEDYLDKLFVEERMPEAAKCCLKYYEQFKMGSPNLRGNVIVRLAVIYQTLLTKNMAKMFGTDDIDVTLPAKTPCVYIMQHPDNHDTFRPYIALFITEMMKEIAKLDMMNRAHEYPVPVNMVLANFPACGKFVDFGKLIEEGNRNSVSLLLMSHDISSIVYSLGQESNWEHVLRQFPTIVSEGLAYPESVNTVHTPIDAKVMSALNRIYGGKKRKKDVSYDKMFIGGKNDTKVWVKGHEPITLEAYHDMTK